MPSVKKNYLYNLLYQLLTLATPLITAPYVSRVLEADGIGIYSYTSAIMSYFALFAHLGTTSYGSREMARLRDDKPAMSKAFWEIFIITALSTISCLIGWFILISQSTEYKPYFYALIPSLIAVAFDISWLYTGIEQMGFTVIRNAIAKIAGIAALFLFIQEKEDLCLYILIGSIIQLLGNLSMWTYLPKIICRVPIKDMVLWNHLKETLSYFVITIAISLYTILDKVLIGLITDDSYQNGYYEQANKIITIAKTLSFAAINSVMGARLSYLFAKEQYEEIKQRTEHSLDYILLISLGLMFGIIAVANTFVPVFFGEGYDPVIYLLIMMAPLIFFIALSTCTNSHIFLPAGKVKLVTTLTIIGAVINFCCNLCLIPMLGAKGAVIGSLIGECLIAYLYIYNCKQFVSFQLIINKSYKKIIAGVCMIGIVMLIRSCGYRVNFLSLFLEISAASLTYYVVLFLLHDSILTELSHIIINRISKSWKNY